ncbi:Wzz/FepE/Etk N-terminal domain-containing protein [Dyella psychrodurans]|uniref:Lipopolysaccharide biosynthesis protein n=1 Tax=Dyella psychrodurans TaxID=1927960 RepID=A0A370X0L0_9GAMM|nr:Wzz/FepE/Etk N-terminal domain-containing protein [Dyella psychrodurans]RDS81939.1 lipopolysaccharide biosynthesis protein [Dyella psychrodurans]
MEHDEIYLIDTWRILVREWKWFAAPLLLVLAATFAFIHVARPQWEATAWIQIGQVGAVPPGQDPKAEPLQRVMERLQLLSFQNDVVKSVGLSPDARDAHLYRKSLKLEPLPYAGPLIKLTLRAYSPQQADQLATATMTQLQAIHRRIEAMPLARAHRHLDEVQKELQAALADRDRLQQAAAPGNQGDAGGKNAPGSVLASALLSSKNEEVHALQQAEGELADRLSAAYTYDTSLMWPVYVPDRQAFPNPVLMWAVGLVLGLLLGALAAIARNALRRAATTRHALGKSIQPKKPVHALTD